LGALLVAAAVVPIVPTRNISHQSARLPNKQVRDRRKDAEGGIMK